MLRIVYLFTRTTHYLFAKPPFVNFIVEFACDASIVKSTEDLQINEPKDNEKMKVAWKELALFESPANFSNRPATIIELASSGLKPQAVSLGHVAKLLNRNRFNDLINA